MSCKATSSREDWGNPMSEWLKGLGRGKRKLIQAAKPRRIVLTASCIRAIEYCLKEYTKKRHEGICYLYGVTGEEIVLAVSAIKPEAQTTYGSFFVSTKSMARVVRAGANSGLQVVGQVHTHPQQAFHSPGDNEGALTAYDGYVSIVLPDYGKELPSFKGAAFFLYVKGQGFIEVPISKVKIVPEVVV